jgi:hypothetical protein
MGHERVGVLPKTRAWRQLVREMGSSDLSTEQTARIATSVMNLVHSRFEVLQRDSGLVAAFGYLLGLATLEREERPGSEGFYPELGRLEDQSVLDIVRQMSAWVDDHHGAPEYAELAKRAAADAIGFWTARQSEQKQLFSQDFGAREIWGAAANGAAFSELSRVFFGKMIERYLKYFLEREASSEIANLEARTAFNQRLHDHVAKISEHSFETTKIAQSFAAGWYNKNATESRPNPEAVKGFLGFASGKLKQEFSREGAGR